MREVDDGGEERGKRRDVFEGGKGRGEGGVDG